MENDDPPVGSSATSANNNNVCVMQGKSETDSELHLMSAAYSITSL